MEIPLLWTMDTKSGIRLKIEVYFLKSNRFHFSLFSSLCHCFHEVTVVVWPATIWRVFSRFFSLVVTYKFSLSWVTLVFTRCFVNFDDLTSFLSELWNLTSTGLKIETKNWVDTLNWVNNEYSCNLATTKFTRLPIARKSN